jgi:hypothetical protein
MSGTAIEALRKKAEENIALGRSRALVAQRFKEITGQDL